MYTHTHRASRDKERCVFPIDSPLTHPGGCLSCVMFKSASQYGWRRLPPPALSHIFGTPSVLSWGEWGAFSPCFRVVTQNLQIFIRLLDNASRWEWIIDGLVRMSGTGQAFNSLCCRDSYPVTMGHGTNTQRNDVLQERGKRKRRLKGAENKIKEACILYNSVGLSHSSRETWQERKELNLQKLVFVFGALRMVWWLCVFVAYICWLLWGEHTYTHKLWLCWFYFVGTNVSSWVFLLTQGAQMGCEAVRCKTQTDTTVKSLDTTTRFIENFIKRKPLLKNWWYFLNNIFWLIENGLIEESDNKCKKKLLWKLVSSAAHYFLKDQTDK